MRRKLPCLLLSIALCLGTATQLTAQQAPEDEQSMELAAKAYEDGMRAYQNKEYRRAVQALRLSYTIAANPLILYNIAIIELDAKRFDDALVTMNEASEAGLPPEEDARNAARRSAIYTLKSSQRVTSTTPSTTAQPRRVSSNSQRDESARRPLWPPVLVSSLGLAALGTAAALDFRLIEERIALDQLARQGDAAGYQEQLDRINTLQRRSIITLSIGATLTAAGLTWLLVRARKNAQRASSEENALHLVPTWHTSGHAGASLFMRF